MLLHPSLLNHTAKQKYLLKIIIVIIKIYINNNYFINIIIFIIIITISMVLQNESWKKKYLCFQNVVYGLIRISTAIMFHIVC